MRRHVVTGGAGFIGSHLCEALVERGDSVVCVDDFSSGSEENIEALAGRSYSSCCMAMSVSYSTRSPGR